jgi:hypothetical protein
VQSAGSTSQDGVIDDESLVKTRTNTCLSYASAVPSYSVLSPSFRSNDEQVQIKTSGRHSYSHKPPCL